MAGPSAVGRREFDLSVGRSIDGPKIDESVGRPSTVGPSVGGRSVGRSADIPLLSLLVDQSIDGVSVRRLDNRSVGRSVVGRLVRWVRPSSVGRSVGRTVRHGSSTRRSVGRQFARHSSAHRSVSKSIDCRNIAKLVGLSSDQQWIGRSVCQ